MSLSPQPELEAVWRVCEVIRGDCQHCPATEQVHGDTCVRGCVAQATECINVVETGNPWRKTEGVDGRWTVLPAPSEAPGGGGGWRVEVEFDMPGLRQTTEKTWISWHPTVSAFGVPIPVDELHRQAVIMRDALNAAPPADEPLSGAGEEERP